MAGTGPERSQTGRDLAVGILLILAAMFLLANVVVATALSVRVLGWTALICGVVLVVRALTGARSGSSWSSALGGVVVVLLGACVLRNPVVGVLLRVGAEEPHGGPPPPPRASSAADETCGRNDPDRPAG